MYTKDKSNRITLRLNDKQFEYVRQNAELLDVSPSDFLRMVINASMSMSEKAAERLRVASDKLVSSMAESEGNGRENDKADKQYLV